MALTENDVVDAVCRFLPSIGWTVTSSCSTTTTGIDIIAVNKDGEQLHVEAKGATSSKKGTNRFGSLFDDNQVKSHVSRAFYTAATDVGTGIHLALAFPNTQSHLKYVKAIAAALKMLEITVFLVSEDSTVQKWGDPITRNASEAQSQP